MARGGRRGATDRVLPSAGEVRLLCTHGSLELRLASPEAEVTRMVLRPLGIGEGWAALRIGEWHTLRNVGAEPVSWLYVMR